MENQEVYTCVKCGKTPDDILILNCNHNICLDCAAKRVNFLSKNTNGNLQTLICEICETPTILVEATSNVLISLMLKNTGEDITIPPKTALIEPNFPRKNDNFQYCSIHPIEPVKYYCFDEKAKPICAECVVSGAHKNHNILNAQNAVATIKAKLNDVLQILTVKSSQLKGSIDALANEKLTLDDIKNNHQIQIGSLFDYLRIHIHNKEREIDRFLTQKDLPFQDILQTESQLENQLNDIKQNVEFFKSESINKSPLKLLNFYAANHLNIQRIVELQKVTEPPSSLNLESNINENQLTSETNIALSNQFQNIGELIDNIQVGPSKFISGQIVKNPSISTPT